MSTNYTGNKTATQSPSPTPNPAITPIVTLPADGDPLNAASVAQALKALADLADWLTKPQAKSTDYAAAIVRFRNALGQTRGLFDHLGLPGGRVIQWDECWDANASISVSGTMASVPLIGTVPLAYSATIGTYLTNAANALTSGGNPSNTLAATQGWLVIAGNYLATASGAIAAGALGSRWFTKGLQTSGIGYALTETFGSFRLRGLSVECGDTAGDNTIVWRYAPCAFSDDLSFAVEWELYVPAANIPHRNIFVGLADVEKIPGAGGTATNYAVFQLGPSGNWFCDCGGSGGQSSVDSLTVATVASFTRFRVEFQGANVADNTTRALRYYINGTLVATITGANLPDATGPAAFHASVVNTGGGSSTFSSPPGPMMLGPARFRSSIYPADVT
jgi:hypothetical protein